MVEEYLRGLLRTTVAGGISSVDVRDVADGLLAPRPRRERAALHPHAARTATSRTASSSRLAGEVDGKPRRTFELPPALLGAGARIGHALRLPVPLSPEEIEAACHYWYVTPARAMR